MEQVCGRLRDLQSAPLTASAAPGENEHPLIVQLTKVLRLEAPVLPDAQEIEVNLGHARNACPAVRVRSVGADELDLGVRPVGRAEVATRPCSEDRAHEVEVR